MSIARAELNLADEIVRVAFPYGRLSEEELHTFELEIGWELPNSYRRDLVDYNGAKFVKNIYPLSKDGWNAVSLDHVYGLHDGPRYFRLQENWKLYECCGLQRWRRKLKGYVVFADTSTGDRFAISGKDGSIWFYDHDVLSGLFEMPGRFTKVESSFSEFLAKLQSREEFETMFADDPRFKAFKTQFERLKAERAAKFDASRNGGEP